MENLAIFRQVEAILQRVNKNVDDLGRADTEQTQHTEDCKARKRNFTRHKSRAITVGSKSQSLLFHPKINKNSVKIAKKLESPQKRLLEVREKKTSSCSSPFRPTINSNSKKIMKNVRKDTQNCWESLYSDSVIKKNKIESQRKETQLTEFNNKECTFRPAITTPVDTKEDLVTRTYNWLKIKQQKLVSKVEKDIDKDLKECSFAPKIHEFKDEGHKIFDNINGLREFLTRFAGKNEENKKVVTRSVSPKRELTAKEYNEAVENLQNYLHSIKISYSTLS